MECIKLPCLLPHKIADSLQVYLVIGFPFISLYICDCLGYNRLTNDYERYDLTLQLKKATWNFMEITAHKIHAIFLLLFFVVFVFLFAVGIWTSKM